MHRFPFPRSHLNNSPHTDNRLPHNTCNMFRCYGFLSLSFSFHFTSVYINLSGLHSENCLFLTGSVSRTASQFHLYHMQTYEQSLLEQTTRYYQIVSFWDLKGLRGSVTQRQISGSHLQRQLLVRQTRIQGICQPAHQRWPAPSL